MTNETIIEAIKGSGGIISTIAKRLNVSWHTADKYIQQSDETKEALADEREAILDMAEGALYGSIKEGNTQDAKWLLATKGRKRGFNEKIDIDLNDVKAPDMSKYTIEELKTLAEINRRHKS
jgi:transposase